MCQFDWKISPKELHFHYTVMISRLDINFELVYFFHNPSYSVTDMLLCDSLDIIDLKTQRMCYGDFQLRDVMLEL